MKKTRQQGFSMGHERLEKWIWILIFGGLLVLVLGLAVASRDAALGWALGLFGALAAALGTVLILVRARMADK